MSDNEQLAEWMRTSASQVCHFGKAPPEDGENSADASGREGSRYDRLTRLLRFALALLCV